MSDELLEQAERQAWAHRTIAAGAMSAYVTEVEREQADTLDALAAEVRRLRDDNQRLQGDVDVRDLSLEEGVEIAGEWRARAEAAEQRLTHIRQLCDDPPATPATLRAHIRRILDAEPATP